METMPQIPKANTNKENDKRKCDLLNKAVNRLLSMLLPKA